MQTTANLRIKNLRPLISPALLQEELPITDVASNTVALGRKQAADIIAGRDDRILLIVGPCSIHDADAAIDYAKRLQPLIEKHKNEVCIIMRVYFEKPRTTVGWKGLINDPTLDNRFDINHGLKHARQLLLTINELGVPTGSEFLDTIIPQYISDLTSWSAIGARTSESQIHRELASGLSMPVGFKNGTTGSVQIAVDAISAAQNAHHFLGVTHQGIAAIVSTNGNPDCHVILRGSSSGPNYDTASIDQTCELLRTRHLTPRLMIDCSHGNSNKDYRRQIPVLKDISTQIAGGSDKICGIMLESNLIEGKQSYSKNVTPTYGQSITDACIGWEDTETALQILSAAIIKKRSQ